MRQPLLFDRNNSSETYVRLGSLGGVIVGVDPSTTGLFGSSLSLASRIMLGDHPETGFRFRASYHEDPYRMINNGYFYDYRDDNQYQMEVRMLLRNSSGRNQGNWAFYCKMRKKRLTLLPEFLLDTQSTRSPEAAPRPNTNEAFSYVWPSYIIWDNDDSHYIFDGDASYMEFPKNVLRETTGYNHENSFKVQNYRPWVQTDRWQF